MAVLRFQVTVVALLVLMTCCWIIDARYLPTRSDNTRKEQIKELLRTLLDLSAEEREMGNSNFQYNFPGSAPVAKRSVSEDGSDRSIYRNVAE